MPDEELTLEDKLAFLGLPDPWYHYGQWADGKAQMEEPVGTFEDWVDIEIAFCELEQLKKGQAVASVTIEFANGCKAYLVVADELAHSMLADLGGRFGYKFNIET